jgi:L-amino acid N-acyltransferase YncA
MLIRHADPDTDAAACAAVYRPFVEGSPVSFEYSAPSDIEFAARIAKLSSTHAFLVAEDDGQVVGFAYGSPARERAAYRWGAGRALYGTLFGLLSRQGFTTLLAGIALPNDASVGMHEALGFELVGVYRRIGWKDAAWHDVGWWQLQLTDGAPVTDPPGPPVRLD